VSLPIFNSIMNNSFDGRIREMLASNDNPLSTEFREAQQLFKELDRVGSSNNRFENSRRPIGNSKMLAIFSALIGANALHVGAANVHGETHLLINNNALPSRPISENNPPYPEFFKVEGKSQRRARRTPEESIEDRLHLREERLPYEKLSELERVTKLIDTIDAIMSHAKGQGENKRVDGLSVGLWRAASEELQYSANERSRARDFYILDNAEAVAGEISGFVNLHGAHIKDDDLISLPTLRSREFVDFLYSGKFPEISKIIDRAYRSRDTSGLAWFSINEINGLIGELRSLPLSISAARKGEWHKWGVDEASRHLKRLLGVRTRMAECSSDFQATDAVSRDEWKEIGAGLNTAILVSYRIYENEQKKCARNAEAKLTNLIQSGRADKITIDAKMLDFSKFMAPDKIEEMRAKFSIDDSNKYITLNRVDVSGIIKILEDRQQVRNVFQDEWLGNVVVA